MALRRFLLAGLLLLLPLHAATATQAGAPRLVRVEALIDGRSQIRLSGDTVQWFHLDNAAPGRHWFRDEPTLLDGAAWYPQWPDVPDRENRDCHCFSAVATGLSLQLPLVDAAVTVRPIHVRWPPRVVESPSSANGYTVVVEFDDNGFSGPEWWIVEIEIRPHSAVFAEFGVDAAEVALAGHAGLDDSVGVSGRFVPADFGDGVDPLHDAVSLDVGRLLLTIPAGSFVAQGPLFTYRGPVPGAASVDAALAPRGDGSFAFAIRAGGTDVAGLGDPETVGLRVGDDEGRVRTHFAGRLHVGRGTTTP